MIKSYVIHVIILCTLGALSSAGCASVTAKTSSSRQQLSCISQEFRLGRLTALPKELTTPLDASIVSKFAVFRRGILARDVPSSDTLVNRMLDYELAKSYKLSGYYLIYVRLLTDLLSNELYYVIPGFGLPEPLPPSHCLTTSARQELAGQQRRRLVEPVYCIIATRDHKTEPITACEPFAAIVEGGSLFKSTVVTGERIVELVPDRVSSVRISYRTGSSITVMVHENAFVFRSPPLSYPLRGELNRLRRELQEPRIDQIQRSRIMIRYDMIIAQSEPISVEWLDHFGRLLRTITPPPDDNPKTSVGNLRAPIEG